jgi:hypothetical protein
MLLKSRRYRKPVRSPLGVIQKASDSGLTDAQRAELHRIAASLHRDTSRANLERIEAELMVSLGAAYNALGLAPEATAATLGAFLANGKLDPLLDALNWVDFGRELGALQSAIDNTNFLAAKESLADFLHIPAGIGGNLDATAAQAGISTFTLNTNLAIIDQSAVAWAQEHAGELVVNITAEVRQNINLLVTDSITGNFTVDQLARQIKMIVPLHDKWAQAVITRRDMLLKQGLKSGMSITKATERAVRMSETYARKLTLARAKTIARTEVMNSVGAGRMNAWTALQQSGLVAPDAKKIWLTAEDERVCDICRPLDNVEVPLNAQFPGGIKTIPAHPNCRCDVALSPEKVGSWATPLGVAVG